MEEQKNLTGGETPQEEAEFTAEELEIIEAGRYSLSVWRAAKELDIPFETVEEAYQGDWDSDEKFVEDLLESCGDMPKDLPRYIHIDWESTAHDVMMDYAEENGHYFRRL